MSPPLLHTQVYVKILEAQNLKGVEKDGTSDPYVVIYVDGKKREKLSTKHIDGTVTPQWFQEFVFTVSSASSELTFRVYDWNRVFSDVLLGTATFSLNTDLPNEMSNVSLNLDTQGSISVLIHSAPIKNPPADATRHLSMRVPRLRVQLERNLYYPGQIMRGALVYAVSKPTRIRSLRLEFDGRSYVYWSEQPRKSEKVLYHALHVFWNITAALYGSLRGNQIVELTPGSYIFPFQTTIPITCAASFHDAYSSSAFNRYTVRAFVDFGSSSKNKVVTIPIRVLPSFHQQLNLGTQEGTSLKDGRVLSMEKKVVTMVKTPNMMRTGEPYVFHCTIHNQSKKRVVEVAATLAARRSFHAKRDGVTWTHHHDHEAIVWNWKLTDLPRFPVDPGAVWEGNITLDMPLEGLEYSLHCSYSPIVQWSYYLTIGIIKERGSFMKSEARVKVIVGPGPRQFPSIHPPPAEDMAPPRILTTAPPQQDTSLSLIPCMTADGRGFVNLGRKFSDIASLPTAAQPPQEEWTNNLPEWRHTSHSLVNNEDWKPGTFPPFLRGDVGLMPRRERNVEPF